MRVNPYLSFNGTCAEAFRFYEKALGGTIQMMMTYGDSPEAARTPPEMKDRVMHVALDAGGTIIMGGDAPMNMFKPAQGFCVSLGIDDESEAERTFKNLSEGATIQMPLQETFWAKKFGMLIDRFGTPWMVNCTKPM